MNTRLIKSSLLAISLLATGCIGSAQVHYQDEVGGVLTLKGAENKAMEHAHSQMAAHCGPGNYRITRKERVVVGQEQYQNTYGDYTEQRVGRTDQQAASQSTSSTDVGRTRNGGYVDSRSQSSGVASSQSHEITDGSNSSTTVAGQREVREFRIHYGCGQQQSRVGLR